jgi:hypothetical protein
MFLLKWPLSGITIIKHFEKNEALYNKCRWEDNIKIDLQELGCWDMDLIELAQGRDRWRARVTAVMNLRVS